MALLLQVLELPSPKGRDHQLKSQERKFRKFDESAYSIVPSRMSSRISVATSTRSQGSQISLESADSVYRRLSFEDDLFTAAVYKRNYRNPLIDSLFKQKQRLQSGRYQESSPGNPHRTANDASKKQIYQQIPPTPSSYQAPMEAEKEMADRWGPVTGHDQKLLHGPAQQTGYADWFEHAKIYIVIISLLPPKRNLTTNQGHPWDEPKIICIDDGSSTTFVDECILPKEIQHRIHCTLSPIPEEITGEHIVDKVIKLPINLYPHDGRHIQFNVKAHVTRGIEASVLLGRDELRKLKDDIAILLEKNKMLLPGSFIQTNFKSPRMKPEAYFYDGEILKSSLRKTRYGNIWSVCFLELDPLPVKADMTTDNNQNESFEPMENSLGIDFPIRRLSLFPLVSRGIYRD